MRHQTLEAPENFRPANELRDFVTRHAETLAAALALSERTRARAELFRVANRTNDRNDYDLDADIIDATISLVAFRQNDPVASGPASLPAGGSRPTETSEPVSEVEVMVASSQERRRRRLMG